jgi:hypothetical protein
MTSPVEDVALPDDQEKRAASVRLLMEFDDVSSPQEAVDLFIEQVVKFGFISFVFRVDDLAANEAWFVRGDKTVSTDEFRAGVFRDEDDDEDADDGT